MGKKSAGSSTEFRVRKDGRAKVQIGAELLCKGGKVDDKITECGVRSTEETTKGTGWLEYGV
jgi:hypothetical protein